MDNSESIQKVSIDNCYELLPKFVNLVLEKTKEKPESLLDICFALCAADENTGTNRLELDIDKFCSTSEPTWASVLGLMHCSCGHQRCTPLPKVQMLRLVSDALVLAIQREGLEINCSYNLEVTSSVARVLGLTGVKGVSNDATLQGSVDSLRAIEDLFKKEEKTPADTTEKAPRDLVNLLEYLASVDSALHRVLSDEFLNNIGNIKIIESIIYRNTYGNLLFSRSFIDSESLSSDCVSFVSRNFSITDEQVDLGELTISFKEYLKSWKNSLVYITHLVVKFYFKVSPVYTTTCLKELQRDKLFPIGVSVPNQNTNIARGIEFDSKLLLSRFTMLCTNSHFTNDSVIGLFTIISAVSSNKTLSESVIRGMIKDARIDD